MPNDDYDFEHDFEDDEDDDDDGDGGDGVGGDGDAGDGDQPAPTGDQISGADLCQALAEGRVDPGVIVTMPDGSTMTVQEFCAGPGGQAGGSIIVNVPGGSVRPGR